jgi:hypothetical protein
MSINVIDLDTNQLVCELTKRIDAFDTVFGVLKLMISMSGSLPPPDQARMATWLRDAADAVEHDLIPKHLTQ